MWYCCTLLPSLTFQIHCKAIITPQRIVINVAPSETAKTSTSSAGDNIAKRFNSRCPFSTVTLCLRAGRTSTPKVPLKIINPRWLIIAYHMNHMLPLKNICVFWWLLLGVSLLKTHHLCCWGAKTNPQMRPKGGRSLGSKDADPWPKDGGAQLGSTTTRICPNSSPSFKTNDKSWKEILIRHVT